MPKINTIHIFFVDNFFHFQVVFILQRSFNFSAHDISTEIWENLKTAEVRREIMEILQKEVWVRKRETTAFLPMQKYVNCKRQGWNFYWKWLISWNRSIEKCIDIVTNDVTSASARMEGNISKDRIGGELIAQADDLCYCSLGICDDQFVSQPRWQRGGGAVCTITLNPVRKLILTKWG